MWNVEEDHLARMTEALGTTFDPVFVAKCPDGSKFFNVDGECLSMLDQCTVPFTVVH